MEVINGIEAYYAKNRKAWRNWLAKNAAVKNNVWLIIYHKDSKTPSIYYAEAVEEALCYGWIDSKKIKRDDESVFQYFAHRKPKSNWSKLNRTRVQSLIKLGLMTEAGQAMIDLAKKSGTWTALEEVENSIIPEDLQKLFKKNKTAFKNFESFSPSSKKMILHWILSARKPETRQNRIEETVSLAAKNIKAHY